MGARVSSVVIVALLACVGGCPGGDEDVTLAELHVRWPAEAGWVAGDPDAVIQFGTVATGSTTEIEVVIQNVWRQSATVCAVYLAELRFEGDELAAESHEDVDPALEWSFPEGTLEVGGGGTVFGTLRWSPLSPGSLGEDLYLVVLDGSNAPCDAPERLVRRVAGVAEGETIDPAPVAICGPDFASAPGESERFDASNSLDPAGLGLSWSWSLTTPPGSGATLDDPGDPSPSIELDVSGEYTATAIVTNPAGSDSCTQTITAIGNENFRVELFWSTAGENLDLHLLEANDGTGVPGEPYTDGDCWAENCTWPVTPPNWGDPTSTEDDPSLGYDEVEGIGPETTVISDPAEAPYDGWYRIFVHDNASHVHEGVVEATLNVYLDGILLETFEVEFEGEGSDVYVARLHWPTGALEACDPGGCP